MNLNIPLSRILVILFLSSILVVSCTDEEEQTDQTEVFSPESVDDEPIMTSQVVKFEGEIFSIPSPVQTAILIKNTHVDYNESLLNDISALSRHVNHFQKAMNMGVYGADLAYLSNFNNHALSIDYFNAIQTLADELGISNNIDASILVRFNENINNQDSLYSLNAELYREINQYLKDNDRNETASLILAGGWIEALHISIDVAMSDSILRMRVGEQRSALNSMIAIMGKYEDKQIARVRRGLQEIAKVYMGMEDHYAYIDPITDVAEKTTYINSKTRIVVTDEQLSQIKAQVEQIRNIIIE